MVPVLFRFCVLGRAGLRFTWVVVSRGSMAFALLAWGFEASIVSFTFQDAFLKCIKACPGSACLVLH